MKNKKNYAKGGGRGAWDDWMREEREKIKREGGDRSHNACPNRN